jgi:dTDP-4-dehydrorhamnose 3,5-epimerase
MLLAVGAVIYAALREHSFFMKVIQTEIPDILTIEPHIFEDDRGFFFESYNERDFTEKTGIKAHFVQDNHSRSFGKVLRGLHYQIQQPQGKLIRVLTGAIFDVAVDLRKNSPTFGKWVGSWLSAENKRQLWIPIGFAHGFLVVSEVAEVLYKTTDYYAPNYQRCIVWNDPDLAIAWPIVSELIISPKDRGGQPFKTAEVFFYE